MEGKMGFKIFFSPGPFRAFLHSFLRDSKNLNGNRIPFNPVPCAAEDTIARRFSFAPSSPMS